ncbi:MAG: Lytic transglycosylase, catalytic, partial [Proteobacteria bacterium]|nr:Lytic transglycosylase, catalytic [Pseudomonadota bacterium]
MKTSLFPIVSVLLALVCPVSAQAAPGDAQFLLVRDAFRAGDSVRLERAAAGMGEHELLPHVDYYRLKMQLEQVEESTVQAFLQRYDGSYVAERLRTDWLRVLHKRGRLADIETEYAKLKAPEQDTLCLTLQARLARKEKAALDEAQALWLTLLDPPETCRPVLDALIVEKRVLSSEVWERIRRQVEANRTNWARVSMAYLPASQTPENRQIDQALEHSTAYLIKLPSDWATTRLGRELAALAVQRVAMNAPDTAADLLEKIQGKMQDSEKQWAWSQIGLFAAKRHMVQATTWFAKAGTAPLSDEAHQWKTRAALRALDWSMVRTAIEAMPAELAARPEWVYWLGRAYKAGGRQTDAQALFQKIAGQPNFYGNLADEELGRQIAAPLKAAELTAEEKN